MKTIFRVVLCLANRKSWQNINQMIFWLSCKWINYVGHLFPNSANIRHSVCFFQTIPKYILLLTVFGVQWLNSLKLSRQHNLPVFFFMYWPRPIVSLLSACFVMIIGFYFIMVFGNRKLKRNKFPNRGVDRPNGKALSQMRCKSLQININ